MSRSAEEMKYLAMRAKKMTARLPEVPSPEKLQASFESKGTHISLGEAQELVVAVEKHRADLGLPPSAQKARAKSGESSGVREGTAQSKPEPKEELVALAERVSKLESNVTVNQPAMKTVSRTHG